MKEIDQKIIKAIFNNVINSICVVALCFLLNIVYVLGLNEVLEKCIEISTIILLFIAIYFFEKAFKNDKEIIFLYGIETLLLSFLIMSIKYITKKFNINFMAYSCTISYLYSIYYIMKSIIIYTKEKIKIKKSYCDIPEILKKEEPLIKEAMKTNERKILEKIKSEEKNEVNNETNSKKSELQEKGESKTIKNN